MKTTVQFLALLLGASAAHAQGSATQPAAVPAGASYLLADGRIALYGSEAMAGLVDVVGWQDPAQPVEAVRVVPLAADKAKPFVMPDKAIVGEGGYPLASSITLYVDRAPKQPIEPFVKDYLAMVLSGEGQAIIARFADSTDGFLPLSPKDLRLERQKLDD